MGQTNHLHGPHPRPMTWGSGGVGGGLGEGMTSG